METKDVILELRTKNGLSQDELAEKIYVTRQAVSRWETGATVPNTETLKLLSKLFDVSINTLLGSPRKLICQCCGMPLDDSSVSKELTVLSMRNIASGAMPMGNLFTQALRN
ncbi:MAG: helix-turn-helix domain-containing protein [Candidatus Avispirillum sp.]